MDWTTLILGGFIGALIAIPFTIVYDLFIKPWIKSIYDRSIFSSRKEKIESLLNEYRKTVIYRNNTSKLIIETLINICGMIYYSSGVIIIILILSSYFISSDNTLLEFFAIYFALAVISMFSLASVFSYAASPPIKVSRFDSYKKKLQKKLTKLGLKPEEIEERLKE